MEELIAICSPIEEVSGIESFIVHLNRKAHDGSKSRDRISVQMPGHFVLQNLGFEESEVTEVFSYIDKNLPVLVDMALERTEAVKGNTEDPT